MTVAPSTDHCLALTPETSSSLSLRCLVNRWDDHYLYVTVIAATLQDADSDLFQDCQHPVCVDFSPQQLTDILTVGMQLNLLECSVDNYCISPSLIVVEPDFLLDISAIAACFQEYGHHPVSYLLNQMKPRANSQAILLGNFAGTALDDLINRSDFHFASTMQSSFREQALQFCTCQDFDPIRFKTEGQQQVDNIREAVTILFDHTYDRSKALLEPSFVCEKLGLQGRVDLMTDDMLLLVEQKSGKNWRLQQALPHPYQLSHYVQVLLYYGMLHYNFLLSTEQTDIRLLYSHYPGHQGLLSVSYSPALFHEAIDLRNHIVAQQISIARDGFSAFLSQVNTDQLLQNARQQHFFQTYVQPGIDKVLAAFQYLSTDEREYVDRMMTFVYREQQAQKIRMHDGQDSAMADLWNMPLEEKLETGNILLGIPQSDPAPSAEDSGYLYHLSLISEDDDTIVRQDTVRCGYNFRRGDMVYIYRYDGLPDVRKNILYKGTIEQLTNHDVSVRLNDRQQNPHLFTEGTYAIEHTSSDIGIGSAVRSIQAFCTADKSRRNLLLGHRPPRRDTTLQCSRSYHPHYDDMLLKARQALDYFLLQGPPGTGKTSMALRFLVDEELAHAREDSDCSLLLTAYTNRAVDEICSMLEKAGHDYLRLGNRASCDPCYTSRLLDEALGQQPRLADIRQRLTDCRIMVATTSTLMARPFLLQLKHFSLCIVDEASQILEPAIIGLLASEQISRFILIGDHKQLPAVVQQPDDAPRLHDCRLSLFERLLQQERQAQRTDFVGLLRRQGRMHPAIAQFPNDHFYHNEQLLCVPLPHQEEEQLDYRQASEDVLDDWLKQHRVLFLPSDGAPENPAQQPSMPNKTNPAEAHIVADLLRRLVRQYGERFDAQQTVGVIVPYRNQIAMIRSEIARLNLPVLDDISIDTVERYQGSQRDVIIYSFTVQQPHQLDFLTATTFEEDGYRIDRKLNVAMTRARRQLLMTGCVGVLRQEPLFAELIDHYLPTAL